MTLEIIMDFQNLNYCTYDYVTVLNTEKLPSPEEIQDGKRIAKSLKSNEIGQMFGYTDRDMNRSLYGENYYWCCKCAHERVITRGQHLPKAGIDKNFPSYYST